MIDEASEKRLEQNQAYRDVIFGAVVIVVFVFVILANMILLFGAIK